jgi:hypothetical protein
MPPDKRRAPPGGSGASSKIIAADSSDRSITNLEIPVSQLPPRPVRADEIPELRALWWCQAALGHRLPAERGVIVFDSAIETVNEAEDADLPLGYGRD